MFSGILATLYYFKLSEDMFRDETFLAHHKLMGVVSDTVTEAIWWLVREE